MGIDMKVVELDRMDQGPLVQDIMEKMTGARTVSYRHIHTDTHRDTHTHAPNHSHRQTYGHGSELASKSVTV